VKTAKQPRFHHQSLMKNALPFISSLLLFTFRLVRCAVPLLREEAIDGEGALPTKRR
jgi:hypothetical protein